MKQPLKGKPLLCYLLLLLCNYSSFSQSNTCASAATVPTTSTCTSGVNLLTSQTIFGATSDGATITGNACSAASTNTDVWYKFVAQTQFPVVTVTPTGTSWFTGAGPFTNLLRVQLLSGTCAGFTEVACGSNGGITATSNPPVTVIPSTVLTPGTTYYVRVTKGSAGAPGGSAAVWNFDICIKEGTASRMNEVFKQTILSAANVLQYPWEITYGPDDSLWITEARGYKVYKMNSSDGGKRVVLDLSFGSTWFGATGTGGADTLYAQQSVATWNGIASGWPQGGCAGLALHPRFGDGSGNDYVYVTYVWKYISGNNPDGVKYQNKLVRFTFNSVSGRLQNPAVLEWNLPGSTDHNSQRLVIAPVVKNGTPYLFMGEGDMGAGQFYNRYRTNNAQNVASYEGKILRFNLDSTGQPGIGYAKWIPSSNPSAASAVWSIGIRNNQGFAYDTATNILYGSSHGPYSDDEINIIEKFKNYGHPLVIGYAADGNYNGTITPGLNTSVTAGSPYADNNAGLWYVPGGYTPPGAYTSPYNGKSSLPPIGNEVTNMNTINTNAAIGGAYKDPLFSAYPSTAATTSNTWGNTTTPGNAGWESEAWSGLDLYSDKLIPGWKRSLVAAGLKWGRLIKLNLDGTGTTTLPSNIGGAVGNAGDTITYFQSGNRYRDLAFAPNGKDIFLIMDNSSATSGPGIGNPTVPACQGCVIKYSFLGYADSAGAGVSTIPKSINVTKGTNNTCNTGTTVTIDATNSNLWVPITGPDGNIMAEIKANGNNLGVVTSSFYQKAPGAIRVKNGVHYLDRNITITPTVQPGSNVDIRLYISKTEYDDLDLDPLSGITTTADIKILKNGDGCLSAASAATTMLTTTTKAHGANGYVLKGSISSFSSFYFGSSNLTLPLDLLTFTGSLQRDNTTLLQWKTENEINASHFIVERSTDANIFIAIGQVRAQGSSNTTTQYSLVDNNIANLSSPVIYYRLKMMDIDGSFKYSNIVPISLADITGKITLAPNPVINEVKVNITAPADGKVQWKLIDNAGRVIMYNSLLVRKGVGNILNIDMTKLANGSYYLSVSGAGINQKAKLQKL